MNTLIAMIERHTKKRPAPNEPFGIVLLEAMACGVPVAASTRGGIPEIVEYGSSGLLSDLPVTEASIVATLEQLITQPALRAWVLLDCWTQAGRRNLLPGTQGSFRPRSIWIC